MRYVKSLVLALIPNVGNLQPALIPTIVNSILAPISIVGIPNGSVKSDFYHISVSLAKDGTTVKEKKKTKQEIWVK